MPEQRTRRDGNTCRRKRPNYRNRAPIFPFAPRNPPAADRSYPPESAHHGRRWPTIRAPVDDLSRCGGPVHPFLASPRRRRLSRGRSEEHTSELQSRLHLVCRLLLEKKKTNLTTARRSHL